MSTKTLKSRYNNIIASVSINFSKKINILVCLLKTVNNCVNVHLRQFLYYLN